MKRNILLYLMALLLLGVASCNKEEITVEDPEIILDPPIEVEYPVATGIVKDKDGVLAEAQVSVYQNGKLVGTTHSNINGEYSTIDIETVPGEDVIIEYSKEEYNSSLRKRSEEVLKESTLDVELSSTSSGIGIEPLIDGIFDYISFSGFVKDLDGNPNDARIYAFLQSPLEQEDGQTVIVNISYNSYTDSEGYYELTLPKEAFDLKVGITGATYCLDYLTKEEVISPSGPAEYMGPFSEDVVLQDYINPRSSAPLIEVSGQVTSCDGSLGVWPGAQIHLIEEDGFTIVTDMEIDNEGNFSYTNNECMELPYTIKIVGSDFLENAHTDTIEVNVVDGVYSNLDIQLPACNTTVISNSTAVMNVGGMEYISDQINPRMENGDLISDEDTGSAALFTIPNIQDGNNNTIIGFQMFKFAFDGFTFTAVNNEMDADVTSLSANAAIISFSGDFTDITGSIVQGSCTLNLNF